MSDCNMTKLDILCDAYGLIQEHGWIRDEVGNKEIGFCTTGAVCEAMYGDPTYHRDIIVSDSKYDKEYHGIIDTLIFSFITICSEEVRIDLERSLDSYFFTMEDVNDYYMDMKSVQDMFEIAIIREAKNG